MRLIVLVASLISLAVATAVGFSIIDLERTTADQILLAVGWAAWGGFLYVLSSLVPDR